MKIDFITAYFYPVWGGAEKHEFHIAKELQKLGHEVKVHTSNLDRYNKKLKTPRAWDYLSSIFFNRELYLDLSLRSKYFKLVRLSATIFINPLRE